MLGMEHSPERPNESETKPLFQTLALNLTPFKQHFLSDNFKRPPVIYSLYSPIFLALTQASEVKMLQAPSAPASSGEPVPSAGSI